MKILIIGAGLSGLVAAIGFRKAGHEVTVLEKASAIREIGAGIQIPINATRTLEELGVLDRILARATKPRDISLRSYRTGSRLYTLNLDPYTQETYRLPLLVIHRADFCRILFEEAVLRGADIRVGCTVSSIRLSTPEIQLTTGEILYGDLIIGADGPHSLCREALLRRPDPPRLNGRLVHRILIDIDEMDKHEELRSLITSPRIDIWAGPNAHVVCYSLKSHFNMVTFTRGQSNESKPHMVDLIDLRGLLCDWDPRLHKIVEIAGTALRSSLLENDSLETWVHSHSNFALLGDAAHACLPFIAHGAAMGIESAAFLSRLLSHTKDASKVRALLKLYNSTQLPRVKLVIARSRLMGEIMEMPNGPAQCERDRELEDTVPKSGFPFAWGDSDLQSLLWNYSPMNEADKVWDTYISAHVREPRSMALDMERVVC